MPGITSLLRSANSTQKKIQAQKDAEVAYNYSLSPKTYENYLEYNAYLDKRAKSASSPSDALSIQKTKDSAFKGHISNEIQRATIDTLEGRGSKVDKYNKLIGFFNQSVEMGQYDLAQTLNLQLDNLQINIQNEMEASAAAAERMAERESKNRAGANVNMVKTLERGLENLTNAFAKGGQVEYNKSAKKFIEQNRALIEDFSGQKLPKDISTSLGQVIFGTSKAIGNYYMEAASATQFTDPTSSADYQDKAIRIVDGIKKFKTPAGEMTLQELEQYANDPSLYGQVQDGKGGFKLVKHTLAGYAVDTEGNITKTPSAFIEGGLPKDDKQSAIDKKQLEKLGFGAVKYNPSTGTYEAQLSKDTDKWFKASELGLPDGTRMNLIKTADGFQYVDPTGKKLYNIAIDEKGLGGLYKVNNLNNQEHISGQYGFEQRRNSLIKPMDFMQSAKQLRDFTRATKLAEEARNNQKMAQMNTRFLEEQSTNYLRQQGVKNYGPDMGATMANRASAAAIYMQPWNQQRGQIGGKYFNYAGNFIPGMSQRNGGGFNFTDANGKAISAFTYAQQTKSDFGQLLKYLGSKGDKYAAQFANNPNAAGKALTWR